MSLVNKTVGSLTAVSLAVMMGCSVSTGTAQPQKGQSVKVTQLSGRHPQPRVDLRPDGVGVARLGSDMHAAIEAITAVLGPPDHVTAWQPGICDSQQAGDKRRAFWGGLAVEFVRDPTRAAFPRLDVVKGDEYLLDFTYSSRDEWYDERTTTWRPGIPRPNIVITGVLHLGDTSGRLETLLPAQSKGAAGGITYSYYPGDPSGTILQDPYEILREGKWPDLLVPLDGPHPDGRIAQVDGGGFCVAD